MVAETVQHGTALATRRNGADGLATDGASGQNGHRRRWFGTTREMLSMPHLIEIQLKSFDWFVAEGLRDLFTEISPISDFTGKNLELELSIGDEPFGPPKYTQEDCRDRDLTYAAPLYCEARLLNKQTQEIKESRIFMGDFPIMTEHGTFIVNGAERVVVSQLVRSPGVYFTAEEDPVSGRRLFQAKLIPNRGAWLEFETSNKDMLTVKVDRKRKIPVTTLLRALGPEYGSDEALFELFRDVDDDPERSFIESTIGTTTRRDPAHSHQEGLIEIYRRVRPGDPATPENARNLVQGLFFNPRRYDLGRVGRYKFNKRLRIVGRTERTLTPDDLIQIVRRLVVLNKEQSKPDDIDHLGNRRIRGVGELIQNQFRIGLLRMERVIKERMTIQDPESATPAALVNIRPVVAAMKEFFGGSQLSQFMDQTNPLAELTHKRRLSALGPGGLSRERAGFDVRDVHFSHYGRICPIETPEGPNIGLIGSLATYGRINEYGFIETPYRRVKRTVSGDEKDLERYELAQDLAAKDSTVVAKAGSRIDAAAAAELKKQKARAFPIRPVVTEEIVYLAADEEEEHVIAQANAVLDEQNHFVEERVPARARDQFIVARVDQLEYMDVSPKQVVSVATALIPFLEHDDANRALMGSNMQRQAVPLLKPSAPLVGTGMEE